AAAAASRAGARRVGPVAGAGPEPQQEAGAHVRAQGRHPGRAGGRPLDHGDGEGVRPRPGPHLPGGGRGAGRQPVAGGAGSGEVVLPPIAALAVGTEVPASREGFLLHTQQSIAEIGPKLPPADDWRPMLLMQTSDALLIADLHDYMTDELMKDVLGHAVLP